MNKDKIKFAVKNGLLHIFGANVLNQLMQFIAGIYIIQLLSKTEYGIWTSANYILTFFLLIQALGAGSGILQFCSTTKDEKRRYAYYKLGILQALIVNTIVAVVIICLSQYVMNYGNYINSPTDHLLQSFTIFSQYKLTENNFVYGYLCLLAFIPLFTLLFEEFQVYLRAIGDNKKYSLLTNVFTFGYTIVTLLAAWMFRLNGVVISRYTAYIFSGIVGYIFIKDELYKTFSIKIKDVLVKSELINFFKFSFSIALTNSVSKILTIIDGLLVAIIISNANITADYKAATLVPTMLAFIPESVIIFVYPYFARNWQNKEWVKKNYNKLLTYLAIANGFIALMIFMFSPMVIMIVGEKYMNAIPILRISAVAFFISGTFRMLAGNILALLRKVKVNFYNALISGISGIILDTLFIFKFGAIGAAYSTVIVFIISSLIANLSLYKALKE